jgi:hypothetical protein
MLAAVDLPAGFEVILMCGPLDPSRAPDDARRRLTALVELGATAATCAIAADSPAHYCDQLAALDELTDGIEGVDP